MKNSINIFCRDFQLIHIKICKVCGNERKKGERKLRLSRFQGLKRKSTKISEREYQVRKSKFKARWVG